MYECECSEDFGACEMHREILAQRVGSSNRSADELISVYLSDAHAIDPACLGPYGLDVQARFDAALDTLDPFTSWIEDRDLAEEASDVAHQVESYLDARTDWDDGYVIYRVTGGPLSLED